MKARLILALGLVLLAATSFGQSLVDESKIKSVEERRILVSIEQEYDKLAEREAELDSREMQLKTLQTEVDKKLAAMQQLRDRLTKLLNLKQEEEGKRVGELSKIYEKMEPGKAARLLKDLDRRVAVELLRGIKQKTAGQILNNLDPETAIELSKAFTEIPVKDKSGY